MNIGTVTGTNALIAHLSRHPATMQATLCSRISVPNYRSRRVYRALLALLDQQPDITYTTQSSGKWWRRKRHGHRKDVNYFARIKLLTADSFSAETFTVRSPLCAS